MLYIAKIIGLIVMLLIPAVAEGQEMVSIERIKEELGENPCWIEAYEYKNHVIDVDVPTNGT